MYIMGKCKYCGKKAGLFHTKHEECEKKYKQGLLAISQIIKDCFIYHYDFQSKDNEIQQIINNSYIDKISVEKEYCSAFDNAIENYLNDGIINQDEETTIDDFIKYTGLSETILNTNKALDKIFQSKILQNILEGNIPTNITPQSEYLPFILSKSEHFLWLFKDITLYQQTTIKKYVGKSSGISVRIMKGVYYKTSGFKGQPIETTIMKNLGNGDVCLTDKNIYFSSPEKSLKIPYSKIIKAESYSNGIEIQKDGLTSKPIFIENIDSWFVYNIIANLKR